MTGVSQTPLFRSVLHLSRLVLAVICVAMSNFAVSQTADLVAPVIELEELEEAAADRSQVFTVQIAEDIQLRDATLYYRRTGQSPYTPTPLKPLGNSGFYSASVPTDANDLRAIEYYVQARDDAGNRTVSGFAFDPYLRTLLPSIKAEVQQRADQNSTSNASQQNNNPSFFQRRWVQISLGVIAAGVIVSLVDDDGEDSQVVPIQINLQ